MTFEMLMKLTIGFLYPNLLNLYGDYGNIECLVRRCQWREIGVLVKEISLGEDLPWQEIDLLLAGGGPDLAQKLVAEDLVTKKAAGLKNYLEAEKVGLFICGSYQLLGQYYRPWQGSDLPGVGILDLYTQHFGLTRKRCVGNVVINLDPQLLLEVKKFYPGSCLETLVGFENHGGRTYLGKDLLPLGKITKGFGNNGEDGLEGVRSKNFLGTYLHGPLLPKNPHLADWLIGKALSLKYSQPVSLQPLADDLAWAAHRKALSLK